MLIHHNYNFIIILVITTIILYYIYTLLNKEHFVVSPPPTPTPFSIVLNTGECMANKFVISPNGKYKVWQQSDGHLVVYNTVTNNPIWYTGAYNKPNGKLCMQTDGNLVNYTSNNVGYWATSTTGNNNQLIIKDDGDLVIRDSVNGNVKWSTNTVGK
jgi:hypothetical protein